MVMDRSGAPQHPSADPDQITLTSYGADTGLAQLSVVCGLFAEVYAEPPYWLGPEDVADFAAAWPGRVAAPNFRLVLARRAEEPVGFVFGTQLEAQNRWWDGALTPLSEHFTAEYPGRTFAIFEIGVRRPYRRQGVARRMHVALLARLTEQRVTLLVLPDARTPRRAYLSWGYHPVGRIRPFPDGPVYDAMIKPLTSPESSHAAGADGTAELSDPE